MRVVYTHCAGLDVHKRTVVACCLTPDPQGGWRHETRTFPTMTVDLLALADWLRERDVTHIALESTGEYWRPVFNILEAEFEMLLVNAAHVKNVPGRKTDVRDAQWLAELLQHGLLRASFIPPVPVRELRDLVRHRSNARARTCDAHEPRAEGVGSGHHQVGERCDGCLRRVGTPDAGGDHRRRC